MKLITLTTDFGVGDWFVGTMKGVIASLAPKVAVVDLTHGVSPGDIRAGAFALAAAYAYFPAGTIHVAVVDPGVGSRRGALAVKTARYLFVGPDNGVLSWAMRGEEVIAVHALENERFFLDTLSRTFHGRDVFAPVAAHLSRGVAIRRLGRPRADWVRLPWAEPRKTRQGLAGEILYVDRFGNAITNIDAARVGSLAGPSGRLTVWRKGKPLCAVAGFYGAVSPGKPVGIVGSSGFLEVAVNGGSAAERLRLRIGDLLEVRRQAAGMGE
jgi:S-adenosyl-L-methionine hydrolase (adenosine-forming)